MGYLLDVVFVSINKYLVLYIHLILYEDSNKKSKLLFFTHIIFKLFYIFFSYLHLQQELNTF